MKFSTRFFSSLARAAVAPAQRGLVITRLSRHSLGVGGSLLLAAFLFASASIANAAPGGVKGKPKPTPTPTPAPAPTPKPVDGRSDWNGTTSSDFNTGANWTPVGVPPGNAPPVAGDVAWFTSTPLNKTVDLSSSVSISGLYFNGTAASGYSITNSSGAAFTLTAFGTAIGTEISDSTAVAIGAENTSDTNTIAAPIALAPTSGTTSTIFQASGGTLVISGAISGTGFSIAKTGGGTLTLSGTNTYTGLTTVAGGGGQLYINGNSSAATGAVNVNSGGTTLGGSGIIGGAVTVASGSNLSPGATGVGSTAVFSTGALTLNSGSFFNVDLNNTTAGSGYDQVNVTGTVSVSGSNLVVTVGGTLSLGQEFFIVVNDNATPILDLVTGTFAQGTTVTSGGYLFAINYLDDFGGGVAGNDISLTVTAAPEPSTWIGGSLALAALAFSQRRRMSRLLKRA